LFGFCVKAQIKDTVLLQVRPPLKIWKANDKVVPVKIKCLGAHSDEQPYKRRKTIC
jgi:hypothetical protein